MEKIKNKNRSDISTRIFAVLLAVVIWLICSLTQYPEKDKRIENIPLSINLENTKAEEKQLSVINQDVENITANVSGMNYEMLNYGASDLEATLDLDSVNDEGTYNLKVKVKTKHMYDSVNIISVYPETVEVTFGRLEETEFPISVNAPMINAADGLTLLEPKVVPSGVKVKATKDNLDKVKKVTAEISESMTISEDESLKADKLVFYDEDDKVLDSSNYMYDDSDDFNVNFDVYKNKEAYLYVDFDNCPPGFDVDTIPYELSEDKISVITSNLKDEDKEKIKIGTISLNNVDFNSVKYFDIKSCLKQEEKNHSGIDKISVSFPLEENGYISKNYDLDKSRIKIVGKPDDKVVTIETKQIFNVKMIGPKETLEKVNADDLVIEIDISNISKNGSIVRQAVIYSENYNNIWCKGKYDVQLMIDDK